MLTSKTALITGAGSGIGLACARMMARRNATILALDRNAEALEKARAEIESEGGRFRYATADVADFAGMRDAVAELTRDTRLDIVVANAGINGVWAPIDDLQPDEWSRTIDVNLTGTYNTMHVTVPLLKAGGGGSVIIISSMNGTRIFTTAGATAYVATKAAQLAMAQQLALELAKHHIRVNAVCPGQVTTSIGESTFKRNTAEAAIPVHWPEGDIPITGGKPGSADDVAEAVTFLASDHARHITGVPLWVDGGQSLLR